MTSRPTSPRLPDELAPLGRLACSAARELQAAVELPDHWFPIAETVRLIAERAGSLEDEVGPELWIRFEGEAPAVLQLARALAVIPEAIAGAMAGLEPLPRASLVSLRLQPLANALVRATASLARPARGVDPAAEGVAALERVRAAAPRAPAVHAALARLEEALGAVRTAAARQAELAGGTTGPP